MCTCTQATEVVARIEELIRGPQVVVAKPVTSVITIQLDSTNTPLGIQLASVSQNAQRGSVEHKYSGRARVHAALHHIAQGCTSQWAVLVWALVLASVALMHPRILVHDRLYP